MVDTTAVIGEIASEYVQHFETATRTTTGETFYRTKDTAPPELDGIPDGFGTLPEFPGGGLIHRVHADYGYDSRDDYRIEWVYDSLLAIEEAIAYGQDLEERRDEIEADIPTWERQKWFSAGWRYALVDEYIENYGTEHAEGIMGLIGEAQKEEKQEVYQAVLDFLTQRAEEREDELLGEEDE